MLLLSAKISFKLGALFFGEFISENLSQGFILGRTSLAYKGSRYTIFRTEPSICYGISSRTSNPDINELLLHADAVLQAHTFVESLI